MRFTGASVSRREDPRLLAGAGRFVDDINRPDLLEAVFVRSPAAHGRLVSIDTGDALAVDGATAAAFLARRADAAVLAAYGKEEQRRDGVDA